MTGLEWFLLIVVVIGVPLIVAVVVTLWTLEQARQRNRKNRTGGPAEPVKRNAMKVASRETIVSAESPPHGDPAQTMTER
jgi:flagellar basal body-associated protein FliL